jgi:spermidine synthase
MNIGVIGLGAGTLAALNREGDRMRFYEISPDVVQMADRWFGYRRDALGEVEVVLGDARIQLERELQRGQSGNFDLLVADAFSGDSIPVHLLTRESAEIYRRHLRDDGILAVHTSNQFLDLRPVVQGMAEHLGWQVVWIDTGEDPATGTWSATWALITSNREFLDSPAVREATTHWHDAVRSVRWEDDYASLFHVLGSPPSHDGAHEQESTLLRGGVSGQAVVKRQPAA